MTGIYRKKSVISKERERKHIPHLRFLFQSHKPHFHHGMPCWPCTLIYLHTSPISCSAQSSFLKRNEYYSMAYLCILGTADQNGLCRNGKVLWWNLFTAMPTQGRKPGDGFLLTIYWVSATNSALVNCSEFWWQGELINEGKRRQERRKPF